MANAKKKMVTAVFRDPIKGQSTYDGLLHRGYASKGINVLMSDTTRSTYFPHDRDEERHDAGTHAAEGMGVGGAIGTAVGATLAAILAIGTSVFIPGLPIVIAGPLAAAFAGGGAGAVTGGVLGALVGLGIPESNAAAYEEALREGGVIIGVVPKNKNAVAALKKYFEEMDGENILYC
jgi:hypothetical protein